MKTKFVGLFLILMGLHVSAHAVSGGQGLAQCNRLLKSQTRRWMSAVKQNLAAIAGFPMWANYIDSRATLMIAAALGVKETDVPALAKHPAKLSLNDGSRLQLELAEWPSFQRTQISLKHPHVIQNDVFALKEFEPTEEEVLSLSLQTNTRLFYLIKELSRGMQLGLLLPIRNVNDTGNSVPFYEMQLGLLKPCHNEEESALIQVFQGDDGETYCVEDLIQFSTWPNSL